MILNEKKVFKVQQVDAVEKRQPAVGFTSAPGCAAMPIRPGYQKDTRVPGRVSDIRILQQVLPSYCRYRG